MKLIYACKDFDHIEFAQALALSKLPNFQKICIVTCTKSFTSELSKFASIEIIPDLNKRRFHKESQNKFERVLESFKPDLVYSVHGSSLITNIISVLKKPKFHHIAKVSYRGVIGNLHYLFNPESLFTHNSSRVDACLGTSEAVVSYLKKQPLIRGKYIDVLYPGVSTKFMTSMAKEASELIKGEDHDIELRLCFLGSMRRKIKGFDILAESILNLSKKDQKKIRLYCIGELPKYSDRYQECESLVFVGFDTNPWRHFKFFDYLVMPSRLEGLGRAGAEAMALGLPVITSGVGGIQEYILNNDNGFLIRSNKADDYRTLWKQLLADPDLKETQKRLAESALQRASFFDPEKIAAKLLETFNEAIKIREKKVKAL